ncbi:MAG: SDR family oxidoreductase [Rhodospirillaceae bacterium]|jgi:3-oxoacyl-[acyl-carrier protein] reductase|nr:SDR family oxidoreductase [Rhodospirillaceae bacterium]
MDLGLKDRHVFLTGGSRGIGRETALSFAEEGARVTAIGRDVSRIEDVATELSAFGGEHRVLCCDLEVEENLQQAITDAENASGPIDVLIHNVGGSLHIREVLSPKSDWIKVWQHNVGIAIDINNQVVPKMVEKGWGRIVFMSSRVAVEYGGAAPYSAAKAYLNAYITILGRELAEKGVLCNGIMPSAIEAAGNSWAKAKVNNPQFVEEFLKEHQAIGRLGTPQDLVPFILLLASEANRFAAGSIFSVDGGSM